MDILTFLIVLAFFATLAYLANLNNKTARETASKLITFFKEKAKKKDTSHPPP